MRLLISFLLLILAAPASADEARPLYIEGKAQAGGNYDFAWRLPPNFAPRLVPELELPASCKSLGDGRRWSQGAGHWRNVQWRCAAPIEGGTFAIRYPQGNPNLATIFKFENTEGNSTIGVFLPGVSAIEIPKAEAGSSGSIFSDYLVLGIEHIWLGLDHLLFVACLIWIAGTPRRILATITGFTAAHSVTLVLAALGIVAVPVRTIEVLIALSIVLLAVELARTRRDTLTWRYPVAVSTCFGLLHGFGFAAVLGEIGLPQDGLVKALLAFNIGIEIGQLIFAAALIALSRAITLIVRWLMLRTSNQSRAASLPAIPRVLVSYAVGVVSTFWILERMS